MDKRPSRSIEAQTKRMPPPALYDLTELQRHANRLYSFSAQRTLELAQALYEKHKLISYPRTDSRHLSQDIARTLPKVVSAITEGTRASSRLEPENVRSDARSSMTARSAITTRLFPPVSRPPTLRWIGRAQDLRSDLPPPLSAWHDEHIWSVTTIITLVRSTVEDRFHSSGSAVIQVGWKVLDIAVAKKTKKAKPMTSIGGEEQKLPPISRKASRRKSSKSNP